MTTVSETNKSRGYQQAEGNVKLYEYDVAKAKGMGDSKVEILSELSLLLGKRDLHRSLKKMSGIVPSDEKRHLSLCPFLTSEELTTLLQQCGPEVFESVNDLDLSYDALDYFPADIRKFTNLKELRYCGNQSKIRDIPPEIGKLQKLEKLGIYNVGNIPAEIGELLELKELDISNSYLTTLPPEIGKLQKLEKLDCTFNPLTSLPQEIKNLPNLKELDIRFNRDKGLDPNNKNDIVQWCKQNNITIHYNGS